MEWWEFSSDWLGVANLQSSVGGPTNFWHRTYLCIVPPPQSFCKQIISYFIVNLHQPPPMRFLAIVLLPHRKALPRHCFFLSHISFQNNICEQGIWMATQSNLFSQLASKQEGTEVPLTSCLIPFVFPFI